MLTDRKNSPACFRTEQMLCFWAFSVLTAAVGNGREDSYIKITTDCGV